MSRHDTSVIRWVFMALGSRGFLHRTTYRDLDDVGNPEMCRRRKKFLLHALSLGAELGEKTFYVVGLTLGVPSSNLVGRWD